MAKNENNVSRWVDERLGALESASGWQPDSGRGIARLRDRQRAARRHRIEWIVASMAGAAACIILVMSSSAPACAQTHSCPADLSHAAKPAVDLPVVTPAPTQPPNQPVTEVPKPKPAPAPVPPKPAAPAVNFKETGFPTAPIVCEVYTDYECPHCALLYQEIIPLLMDQYVRTGKVKLLHRDFPLPQHPYARLAARYANAAGAIGQYDAAVNQIFQTQNIWRADGSVDAQLAQALSPEALQKIRDLVAHDPHLDDTVAEDVKMGTSDNIRSTPTLVIVANGKRQAIGGVPQFDMLQTYLDQLLSAR
ncbi:DSBA oxidoreductase [Candidatus Sulfopaludibacter sp. SbA3]|nr:DSBA oxidoreductase [Candidatus Sulfopaludibacter sp. SbA3]